MIASKDNAKAWDFDNLDLFALSEDEGTRLYMKLFNETWHSNHENIASYFQGLKDPLTVDILYKTALRNDIMQFDYKPLSRKCVWALADIGTEKAKNCLEQLATSGDEVVEAFAKRRLEK